MIQGKQIFLFARWKVSGEACLGFPVSTRNQLIPSEAMDHHKPWAATLRAGHLPPPPWSVYSKIILKDSRHFGAHAPLRQRMWEQTYEERLLDHSLNYKDVLSSRGEENKDRAQREEKITCHGLMNVLWKG